MNNDDIGFAGDIDRGVAFNHLKTNGMGDKSMWVMLEKGNQSLIVFTKDVNKAKEFYSTLKKSFDRITFSQGKRDGYGEGEDKYYDIYIGADSLSQKEGNVGSKGTSAVSKTKLERIPTKDGVELWVGYNIYIG